MKKIYTYITCLLFTVAGYAQINPILIEAEAASLIGNDYTSMVEEDTTYLTPSTDFANADYPGTDDKVLTFSVPFATAGDYHFYIKLRVGPDGPNDDSFYFGNNFGTKDSEEITDWVKVNNIQNGAAHPDSIVSTDTTGVGNEVFKWVNASLIGGGDDFVETLFEVSGAGDQIFQIGAREDGLDFDKIAFAEAGVAYTVDELENPVTPSSIASSVADVIEIKMYPNPSSDLLNISLPEKLEMPGYIHIYGQTGVLIKRVALNDQNMTINIEDINSGIYLMKSYYNNKEFTQKFIIE